jgi:hypothetical protein
MDLLDQIADQRQESQSSIIRELIQDKARELGIQPG